MHKNIYRRYALVGILLCLWVPAKSLIASHREPLSEVSPDYNENFVVQTSLTVPDFSPSAVYYEQNNIAFAFRNRNETGNTEIYRSLNSDMGYELIATVPHTASQYHDINLENHTTYYYKLRAVDGDDASALSEPGSFTSYAKNFSPTLTATALNDTTIELRLTDNSFNDYIYEIYSVGSAEPAFYESFLSPTDSGSVVVFTHHPVSPGTAYTYQVNMTTYGEDMPTLNNVASATATTPEASFLMVPDFSPFAVYYDQNNIAFAFRNRNETGNTEIYRSLSSDTGYELIATVPHTATEYHDISLENHTTYYYKLRAVDGDDASALSEPGSFTSYAKNFPPTLTATALNDTTIELRLTDNSFNDYIYEIYSVSSAEPAFYESFLSPTDSGSVVVFTHHPVSPGTAYTYQVNMTTYGEDMPTLNNVASATATTPDEAGDETNAGESSKLSLYPNPSLKREVTLSLHDDNKETLNAADIEVVSVSGTVVYRERIDCAGGCSDILLSLNNNVPPGIYTVNINSYGKRLSKRLMLK